ncbi:probable G-protein coupled receptor B0563.6 [Lingula anatina]|uniref:Probable G-protein coupled receptor B0563.6 n=1 Tax=Lingula anatina TaxID=7574 RepID=A0A2R2MR63_LINAN|nr:probable G-protein coupled receptor B0563.6 [Lingula anatina]|eukprot:XP_023932638.1 probable G-protein coupled receptor B0563.6 [Lingula anatina]
MNNTTENVIALCQGQGTGPWEFSLLFYVQSVAGIPLITLGLIGNAISFLVLCKDTPKSTTSYTLQALAIADSLYLLCHFFFLSLFGIVMYAGVIPHYKDIYAHLMLAVKPLMYISQQASIWLIVLVTADRYMMVCRPWKAGSRRINGLGKAKRNVLIVLIATVLYNVPRFFEMELGVCFDIHLEHLVPLAKARDWASSEVYQYLYVMILNALVMFFIPMAILTFVNSSLIIAIRNRNRRHVSLTGRIQQNNGMTSMLVGVVLVFVCCQTCDFILQILYYVDQPSVMTSQWFPVYYQLSALLLVINASTNFIIYCLCSRKFRQLLLDNTIFGACRNGSSNEVDT